MENVKKFDLKRKLKDIFSFLKNGNSLFYYFLFLLGVGLIFFFTSLFFNYFTTPFTGDYNTQQYAFYLNTYDDWWHFIKTGSFRLYDTNTYLGVNNIGSNTFYSLFDPFFFLVLFFPRAWMGQAMAISTIFRMSFAGFAFYGYLRYMKVSDRSARLAGLAFAYCGWTTWYLWFNCYTENAIVFVLLLWGVEKIIKEKKPWILMASLFLSGLTNYFFFICFIIMAFIYAMFRWFQELRKNTAKDNLMVIGIGFVAFLVGILMASVIVLPSVMVALEAPRATSANYLDSLKEFFKNRDFKKLFDYIFSWDNIDNKQSMRKFYPFIDFFFPAMSDRGTPLTQLGNETYDNVAGSLFSYYPFTILLMPAIIWSVKNKKWSHLIAVTLLVFTIFTPFFYYLFFGFTKPYSRWTIFVTTSLLTYTAMYLDHIKELPKWTLFTGSGFTVMGIIASGVMADYMVKDETNKFTERFSISASIGLSILYVAILSIVMFIFINHKHIKRILYGFLVVEAGVMGALTIYGHGTTDYMNVNYGYNKNTALASIVNNVQKNDPSYYRAYSSIGVDANKNDGARNGYNGTSFFHSLYNFNVTDFSYWSMILTTKTGWSGRYVEKRAGLDKFLGIKYYFVERDRMLSENANVPFDYIDITDQYPNNYFNIYMDTNHIDFALTYDDIYAYKEDKLEMEYDNGYFSSWTALRNDDIFMKGAVLEETIADEIIEASDGGLNKREILSSSVSMDAKRIYYPRSTTTPWSSKTYKMDKAAKKMDIKDIITAVEDDSRVVDRPTENKGLVNVVVVRPNAGHEDDYYDENGMVFYINATFLNNQKEDIYLIDTEGNVIVGDNHNDDRGSDTSSRRGPRAFYVKKDGDKPAPKVKEIIIIPRWSTFNQREEIYVETYTSFKTNKLDEQLAYSVTDIHYRDNHFDFKSNFASKRFIITQIAYDDGWTITAKLPDGTVKKVEKYLTSGGFVGFLSETGEVAYQMNYYTPYLRGGIYISSVGFLVFVSTLLGYIYLDERSRKLEIEKYLNLTKEAR